MNRLLKITAQIVGLLILLYIAIMILLMIFVNTKDFKPVISKTFYEMTGQKLKIDGDIHLRIFPWPSIKATNLTLENPKAFPAPVTAPFLAKVGQLSVRLRAAALLKGNIDPANILLSNV
ncbi:MAG: AsmA family protein, partial [Coxiellaceae bacterium]|nr:AsmA family protein [Coxiellaceae bacterium]